MANVVCLPSRRSPLTPTSLIISVFLFPVLTIISPRNSLSGEVHCDDRPSSNYDLSLCRFPDGLSVGIDASAMGNEARFINDYRGISPRPNAIFSDIKTDMGAMRMSIWSSAEIRKGEEILVSYGKAWWRARSLN